MSAGKQRIPSFEQQIAQAMKQPTPAERLNRVHAPKVAPEVLDGLRGLAAKPITLELPLPPSVNHYWRHVGARTLISRAGREYAKRVEVLVLAAGARQRLACLLSVVIDVYFPDRRRRDLDNALKALGDSLTKSGVWLDDSQISELTIRRAGYSKPGHVVVAITPIHERSLK